MVTRKDNTYQSCVICEYELISGRCVNELCSNYGKYILPVDRVNMPILSNHKANDMEVQL